MDFGWVGEDVIMTYQWQMQQTYYTEILYQINAKRKKPKFDYLINISQLQKIDLNYCIFWITG